MKPPLGARINPAHPFVRGHILSMLFDGSYIDNTHLSVVGSNRSAVVSSAAGGWNLNAEGPAWQFAATTQSVNLGTGDTDLPTVGITILIIRKNTTIRNACFLDYSLGSVSTEAIRCYVPYGDGVVYWDFGGNSGNNRLTVSSLSFSVAVPERWVFTAGAAGMSIWQNGVKVASHANAVTRVSNVTPALRLNIGSDGSGGDLQQVNFLSMLGVQWSDDLCRWWSISPYAHLSTPTVRRYAFLMAATPSGSPTRPYLSSLGVG